MDKKKRRKPYKEDETPSSYELDVKVNEQIYQGHFSSIETAKRLLSEAQNSLTSSDDPRIKKISLRIIKKVEKQLTELEKKTPQKIEFYERTKKRLESLL